MGALLGRVKGEPGRLQGVGAVASGLLWPWFSLCSQGRSGDGEYERSGGHVSHSEAGAPGWSQAPARHEWHLLLGMGWGMSVLKGQGKGAHPIKRPREVAPSWEGLLPQEL